ncbi:hypothetical protein FNF29_06241 [Cafeteria roenbergensis]|uniref:Protein kinase domain-containing protein n=1 Tax=Cafeteria roenbergensis TaxID=33653 RepID=A0A5A8C8G6_CAFRO|nr:hypothetical protein FNF29_06241 [Cafeteria roenbergensis]|eukprot:KAA0148957.1 hypothetical protein FNF29_06241 [Cafeteria roenbergensis]
MGNTAAFRKQNCRAVLGGANPEYAWAVYDGSASADPSKRMMLLQFPADAAALRLAGVAGPASSKPSAAAMAVASNAARRHRSLVHPHILKLHGVSGGGGSSGGPKEAGGAGATAAPTSSSSGSADSGPVVIACEPAVPLFVFLASGRLARLLAAAEPEGASTRPPSQLVQQGAAGWLAAGAHALGSALAFLHERGIAHGAVGPSSVFVTEAGEWRLGMFCLTLGKDDAPMPQRAAARAALCPGSFAEPGGASVGAMESDWHGFSCCVVAAAVAAASKAAKATVDDVAASDEAPAPAALAGGGGAAAGGAASSATAVSGQSSLGPPPTAASTSAAAAAAAAATARESDEQAAALAADALSQSSLAADPLAVAAAAASSGTLPRAWLRWVRTLLDADPLRRGGSRTWNRDALPSLLRDATVTTIRFLAELPIKTPAEKQSFFGGLPAVVPRMPRCLREGLLLPRLLEALEFGQTEGGGTAVLAPVLAIGAGMSRDEYRARVAPAVVRLFASRDRATRVQLMRHAASLLPHIDQKTLHREVWPRAAEGLGDTASALRDATLKALPAFARSLPPAGHDGVVRAIGQLLKDPLPGLRANAAVCAGMVAESVGESVRGSLVLQLLAAIAKDEEPRVRAAGVRAAAFVVGSPRAGVPAAAAAGRALQLAGAAAMDADQEVRAEAVKLIRACAESLSAHNDAAAASAAAAAADAATAAPASSKAWDFDDEW